MILLDSNQYHKASGPLGQVTINNLFARVIAEKHLPGRIYVDNTDSPDTFYIIHPYGMSLLLGNSGNNEFNARLRDYALNKDKIRDKPEWMQTFPESWDSKIEELFGDAIVKPEAGGPAKKIELHTRVNFKFNQEKYFTFKKETVCGDVDIVRTDMELFKRMHGTVVPMYFWKDAAHFYNKGIGFSLYCENQLATTAFAANIIDNYLEIGIETMEKFRGKGLAQYTCDALIDYCLKNGYEPVWACRLENTASYYLAQKLGFEPTLIRPYYKLCV